MKVQEHHFKQMHNEDMAYGEQFKGKAGKNKKPLVQHRATRNLKNLVHYNPHDLLEMEPEDFED
jgi:hypothetical protein